MNKNIVGKGWYRPHRGLYRLFLAALAACVLFFVVSWVLGHSMTISWNTVAQGESIPVIMDYVNVGPFHLPISIDNFLLTEYFEGSGLHLHTWASYTYLVLNIIIFALLLAIVTTFRQFWYLVGMALVIVFLLNLKLEMLQLFGQFNKIGLIISFILFLPVSYYFHSIKSSVPLLNRFIIFLALAGVLGSIIYFFSEVQSPFLYVVSYGYLAPIILTLVFILLVANEIVTGFVYATTSDMVVRSKKNFTHFLIVTTIYILNLGLLFFDKFLYLNLGIDFIHPYLLLLVSAVLGFVFYPLKEKVYGNIFKYYPSGALIFVSLASVCFFTIGYYTFTANDPVLQVFKKFILYGHLGYGLMFLVYIIANFLTPFGQGLPVYKILYDPHHMPYFTFRFAGTVATLALLLVTNYEIPLFNTISSYNNGLGDLHAVNGEVKIAEAYYRKGGMYGHNNHRSNYAMASIARSEGDNAKAIIHYNNACQLRPTEQSIVNMSNIYKEEGKPFQALFTLQDGLKVFPNSTYIKNNLGLLYDKVAEKDSAFIMFHEVNKANGEVSSNAGLNLLSLVAKGNYEYNTDSLIDSYGSRNHLSSLSNVAVLYNINNQYDSEGTGIQVDSVLNLISGYALYNCSLNQLYGTDSIYTNNLFTLSDYPQNTYFSECLKLAGAIGSNKNGNTYCTFNELKSLAANNYLTKGQYYDLMGLLALQQQSPRLAIDCFETASANNYVDAKQHLGIAYMEYGWENDAREIWNQLQISGNPVMRDMAEKALSLYQIDPLDPQIPDNERYLGWYYQIARNNELKNEMVLKMMEGAVYKNQMLLDLFEYHMSSGNFDKAVEAFGKIDNNAIPQELVKRYGLAQLTYADLESNQGKLVELLEDGHSSGYLSSYDELYYQARMAEMEGDTALASTYFERYASNAVFEEFHVIQAANYFEKTDSFKAYNLLQKALEVNVYSVSLLKAYILQCGKLEFELYANHALGQLRELVSGQEYALFEEKYRNVVKQSKEQSGYF